ncbi:hypothetical protein Sjap_020579 [Stephania japonica]|uniref:Uncharacterized protein n=1 Tax=Stephania japonica TaxID=461633 RepID=A0AAP0F3M6_9MAGN
MLPINVPPVAPDHTPALQIPHFQNPICAPTHQFLFPQKPHIGHCPLMPTQHQYWAFKISNIIHVGPLIRTAQAH